MLLRLQICLQAMILMMKTEKIIRGLRVMRVFKSFLTVFAAKLSSTRCKKILSLLAIVSLFCISMNSGALSAVAIDSTDNYIELSQILMDDILSDCTWYYENTSGGYSAMSSPFIFHTTGYDLSLEDYTSNWWYDTGQNVRDLYVCYWNSLPADIAEDSGFQFSLLCNFSVYFSNITHLDISASCYPSYDRRAIPASSYSSHFYAQIGENDSQFLHMTNNFGGGSPDSQNFSISNYIMNGNTNHPPLYNGYSGCAVYNFDREIPSNCQLGDFLLCNIGRARFSSDTPYVYYVVFSGIRVNSGYLYHGHDSPSPPVTTPDLSGGGGSGGGVITTDASGNTGFQYTVTMQFPQYIWSGSYTDYTDNFPATLSSIQSGFGTYETEVASALSELADDVDVSGIMDAAAEFIPAKVVILIMGVSGIWLVGWVLNRLV